MFQEYLDIYLKRIEPVKLLNSEKMANIIFRIY